MKMIVNRNAFSEAMKHVARVAAARSNNETLRAAKLEATKDELILSATDLELCIRIAITQVEIKEPGAILVPADRLLAVANSVQGDTLDISVEDWACVIRGTNSTHRLNGADVNAFPPIIVAEGEPNITIGSAALLSLISKTLWAASKDNTRYAISGILWEPGKKTLRLVATCGRRIAIADAIANTLDAPKGIATLSFMSAVRSALAASHEAHEVRIWLSANRIAIETENLSMSGPLAEGHFPEYREVFPKTYPHGFDTDVDPLVAAVESAALATDENSKGLQFSFDDGKLSISAHAAHGDGESILSVNLNGLNLALGIDPAFLIGALRAADFPIVRVEVADDHTPLRIRTSDYVAVIALLNLK